MSKISLNKKKGKFLNSIIAKWVADGTIAPDTADTLKGSFDIRPFDYKRLAKYSFWVAIICLVIAFGSVFMDRYLVRRIIELLSMSYIGLCIIFALLSAIIYMIGLRRRQKRPEKVFSNEAIIFVGVLLTSASIAYLGKALDDGNGHFSLLFLLATGIYGALGLWFPSKLVWIFSLLSLASWFGAETGYMSGWGAYFLGMNYPMRFVLFGIVLIVASFSFKQVPKLAQFSKVTYIMGLLYGFIALWLISIFGNYSPDDWYHNTSQAELMHWGILFALAAIGAIFYGLKADDHTSRSFGIVFLFINLYTKYFEFFWDSTHKAIFFAILAASFWFIGSRAEKIWNLEFLNKATKEESHDDEE